MGFPTRRTLCESHRPWFEALDHGTRWTGTQAGWQAGKRRKHSQRRMGGQPANSGPRSNGPWRVALPLGTVVGRNDPFSGALEGREAVIDLRRGRGELRFETREVN